MAAEARAQQMGWELRQMQAAAGESIGAMRSEALSRAEALDAQRAEVEALRSQLAAEAAVASEAQAALRTAEARVRLAEERLGCANGVHSM